MSIVISSGHGLKVRGASGYIDEVDEARKVVDRVGELLRGAGVGVKVFHDNTSTSQSQNLDTIVSYHNAQTRDLDVSVHFNAYQTTSKPMGTEVLYVTQASLAEEVSEAIAQAGGFIDRGGKKRTDLAFFNTHEPAILIETCFVDSQADVNLYRENFEIICNAIAEAISGESIAPPEPEPPQPQPEPPTEIPTVQIAVSGNVRLIVNGQDIPLAPAEAFWHENVTATVFGSGDDEQESAYGGWIDGDTVGVSFPYKWRDGPPPSKVIVEGPLGTMTAPVVDVGPWNTDDPAYVLDVHRPLAEQQYKNHTTAQNGRVPTNDAGIDLTAPVAEAIGIIGKGKVRWRFA
jgi:N-acetylmuramoyl-L-alanine amidase